jgi:hypothetical protein
MKIRATLALAGLAAVPGMAFGQASTTEATVSYALSWQDTGNNNGVVEPGEGAHFRLTVTMTPGVGTIVNYTGGLASSGALRGIASGFVDLNGTNNAAGAWSGTTIDEFFDLVPGGLGHGTPAAGGSQLQNIQFGQFPVNNASVNTTNPIVNVFEGTWTPADYTSRVTLWNLAAALASGGNPSSVIIRPNNTGTTVESAISLSNLGGTISVPIVPAPSSLALLGLGGLIAGRRRR